VGALTTAVNAYPVTQKVFQLAVKMQQVFRLAVKSQYLL
jgi:hypothetical protein